MSDEQEKRILHRILGRILFSSSGRADRPGAGSRHGIYVFDRGSWRFVEELDVTPSLIYAIYFDNTRCPACRLFDDVWFKFSESLSLPFQPVVVLCGWFAGDCESRAASELFRRFRVSVSPTTVFARAVGGRLVEEERIEGFAAKSVLEKAAGKLSPSAP